MSKKSVDLLVDGVKKYGPQAGKLIKEHQKEIKGRRKRKVNRL